MKIEDYPERWRARNGTKVHACERPTSDWARDRARSACYLKWFYRGHDEQVNDDTEVTCKSCRKLLGLDVK